LFDGKTNEKLNYVDINYFFESTLFETVSTMKGVDSEWVWARQDNDNYQTTGILANK